MQNKQKQLLPRLPQPAEGGEDTRAILNVGRAHGEDVRRAIGSAPLILPTFVSALLQLKSEGGQLEQLTT